MATPEHSPAYRNATALTVGLLCLAPVCAVTGRLVLGLVLLVLAAIGGAILWSSRSEVETGPRSRRLVLDWPRVRRGLERVLITTAIGLSLLACFLFAIPHFPGGVRPWGNESAAIATLKNLAEAEAEFHASRRRDRDRDGIAEFGTFADLASEDEIHAPLLSPAFRNSLQLPDGGDLVVRSGYLFRIYLPGAGESGWRCYAWPTMKSNTGKRAFFVDQTGAVLWTNNRRQRYSGTTTHPAADAALPADGLAPADAPSRDGGVWRRL